MNKQLTIVIPCKNEGREVLKVLGLIRQQHIDCQIIVADSSTDADTFNLLFNYKIRSPQLIKVVRGGLPAVARNRGAEHVRTPYILFIDADIYLKDPIIIRKCVKEMMDGNYDLLTCRFKSFETKYNWAYRFLDIIQRISSIMHPLALGGFMLFRTSAFNQLGRFNENDKIAEDYHLSLKVKASKFKIVNRYVYTTNKQFEKKGTWNLLGLAITSWWNRNNDKWFARDQGYWD